MNFLQNFINRSTLCLVQPTAANNADNGITEYFGSFNSSVSQNPEGGSKQ